MTALMLLDMIKITSERPVRWAIHSNQRWIDIPSVGSNIVRPYWR